MKKLFLLFLGVTMGFAVEAQQQVKTPAPSPKANVKQTVGLTNFEVTYSRPSLKGRKLIGGIIQNNELWRFGANESTTISFDTPVNINGTDVKPGTYAMYATPTDKEWTVYLYSDTKSWGAPKSLNKKDIVLETKIGATKLNQAVETFTISFDNLGLNDFILNVAWEHVNLPIKITLPTKDLTIKSIQEVMAKKPTEMDYFRAASYYLNEQIELDKAAEYMDAAIKLNGNAPAYYVFNKAVILSKLNRKEDALKTAQEAKDIAKKQKYDEYVRKSDELIKSLK